MTGQPGHLFQYDEHGAPQGLVHGKKLVCVTSRGADYSGPLASLDFLESYLRTIFGFVGIADQTFFNAQPMDVTPELRRTAFASTIAPGAKPAVLADQGRGTQPLATVGPWTSSRWTRPAP